MKKAALTIVLVPMLTLFLPPAASTAAIITSFTEITEVNIGGIDYRVWDMMVTVTDADGNSPDDWLNSFMDLTLTTGSMFNPQGSSNTEPDPFVDLVPALEWDTCAAIPGGAAIFPIVASFAEPPTIDATDFNASWFDSINDGLGTHKVARITLSFDANGDLTGTSFDNETAGVGVPFDEWFVRNGRFIPEPVSLTVLSLCLLPMIRRRHPR